MCIPHSLEQLLRPLPPACSASHQGRWRLSGSSTSVEPVLVSANRYIASQQRRSTIHPERGQKGRCPESLESQRPWLGLLVIAIGSVREKEKGTNENGLQLDLLACPRRTHGDDPEQNSSCVHEQKCTHPAMNTRRFPSKRGGELKWPEKEKKPGEADEYQEEMRNQLQEQRPSWDISSHRPGRTWEALAYLLSERRS